MEDITPLNLEDHPKLFGMRYDQLISILISMIAATQIYSWTDPVMVAGQDIRLDFCILIFFLGPLYSLVTMNNGAGQWETLMNFYFAPQVYIPGPDPNPTRFLVDEELVDFYE